MCDRCNDTTEKSKKCILCSAAAIIQDSVSSVIQIAPLCGFAKNQWSTDECESEVLAAPFWKRYLGAQHNSTHEVSATPVCSVQCGLSWRQEATRNAKREKGARMLRKRKQKEDYLCCHNLDPNLIFKKVFSDKMECSSFTFYTKYYFHYSIKICIVVLGSKLWNQEHYSANLPNTIGQIVCFDNLAPMTQCNRMQQKRVFQALASTWLGLCWNCFLGKGK